MRSSTVLPALFLVLLIAATCQGSPSGYTFEWKDVLYKFIPDAYDFRTWLEAEEICQREESGHLLSMVDSVEQEWINSKLQYLRTRISPNLGRFWLGAVDSTVNPGIYEYSDGVAFKMLNANWGDGEPNRPHTVNYEHCIALDSNFNPARFFDFDCYKSFGYICKTQGLPRRLVDDRRFGYEFTWNKFVFKYVILAYDWLPWQEAELYCRESEFGHLASLTNAEDVKNLTQYIKVLRRIQGFRKMWIGGRASETGDGYSWSDMMPFRYTAWASGEPAGSPRDCTAVLGSPHFGKWTNEDCADKLPFICKTRSCLGKTDLVFVVDSSGSVTSEGFNKAKDFVWQVVRHFTLREGKTQVGVVRYSNKAELVIRFKQFSDHQRLRQAINNIAYTEGGTRTSLALRLARMKLFSIRGGTRDGVAKILILLTDGMSESSRRAGREATRLKRTGVYIVPVGIGEDIDMRELKFISSSKNNVINAKSYKALRKRVRNIRDIVCARMDPDYRQYRRDIQNRS